MKAWVNKTGYIKDIAHSDPFEIYHNEIAVFYNTEVPDDAAIGDSWINDELIKFVPPTPDEQVEVEVEKVITLDNIRTNLSLTEKVKWDNNKTEEIITAKNEFITPLTVINATQILQFLVDTGSISQESMNKILA